MCENDFQREIPIKDFPCFFVHFVAKKGINEKENPKMLQNCLLCEAQNVISIIENSYIYTFFRKASNCHYGTEHTYFQLEK